MRRLAFPRPFDPRGRPAACSTCDALGSAACAPDLGAPVSGHRATTAANVLTISREIRRRGERAELSGRARGPARVDPSSSARTRGAWRRAVAATAGRGEAGPSMVASAYRVLASPRLSDDPDPAASHAINRSLFVRSSSCRSASWRSSYGDIAPSIPCPRRTRVVHYRAYCQRGLDSPAPADATDHAVPDHFYRDLLIAPAALRSVVKNLCVSSTAVSRRPR